MYYLSQSINQKKLKLNKNSQIQNIEIGDIKWFTFNEGINKIRDYNIEKKNIFRNIDFILRKIILNSIKFIENTLFKNKNYEII